MTPNKVIRDGKVAVLISPGFGAGWSTWADEDKRQMLLFDERFVAAHEKNEPIDEVVKIVFGAGSYVYTGGWKTIEIIWLLGGTAFVVEEYDGSESLRTHDDLVFIA